VLIMRVPTILTAALLAPFLCTVTAAQTDLQSADAVKEYYNDWLSSIPGVTGVEAAESQQGTPEIEVHARVITDQIRKIPPKLNGVPVIVFKDAENPDEPATKAAIGESPNESPPAASADAGSQPADVNHPVINESVAPTAPTAPTMQAPTAPVAVNPLGTPQEGQPPQPEGMPPPGIR
jgi:hypothetical protein